jgi:hypothetical protein
MLQIAGLIVFNLIILSLRTPRRCSRSYSIPARGCHALVMNVGVTFALASIPEAYAKGDMGWLRKTFWRMARITG